MRKSVRWAPAVLLALLWLAATGSLAGAQSPRTKQIAAERVTIQYEAGSFSLSDRRALRKVLPPSDEFAGRAGPFSGFWYELQDADGSVLYRRLVDNPLILHFEGPDIDTGGTVPDRKEAIAGSKTLSFLIPAPPASSSLVLFSSPLGAQAEAAQEIGRVPLFPIIVD